MSFTLGTASRDEAFAAANVQLLDESSQEQIEAAFGPIAGTWKLSKLENAEAKLIAQGVGWFTRKLLLQAPMMIRLKLEGNELHQWLMLGHLAFGHQRFKVGGAEPTKTSAFGKTLLMWYAITSEGEPIFVCSAFPSDAATSRPSFTIATSYEFSSTTAEAAASGGRTFTSHETTIVHHEQPTERVSSSSHFKEKGTGALAATPRTDAKRKRG